MVVIGDLLVITTPCSQQVETFHAVQWKLWLLAECHILIYYISVRSMALVNKPENDKR